MKRKCFSIVALSLVCMTSAAAFSQASKNMVLSGFISTGTMYGRTVTFSNEGPIADVWGWTYQGKEYALVCLSSNRVINNWDGTYLSGAGVAIVDVTDPNNIAYKKTIRFSNQNNENAPSDVKIWNNYAFVAQDGIPTYYVNLVTAINNLSDPTAGVEGFIVTNTRVHTLQIDEQGLLFLSHFFDGVNIGVYNVNGPTSNFSTKIGEIPVITGPNSERSHATYVRGNRVYDSQFNAGIVITDFTFNGTTVTPGTQRQHKYNNIRSSTTGPSTFPAPLLMETHSTWISTNGQYLFSNEEGRNTAPAFSTNGDYQRGIFMRTWDISSINAPPNSNGYRYPIKKTYQVQPETSTGTPQFADSNFTTIPSGEYNSIHHVLIRNENNCDVAYISYYTKGIRVLNVLNPLSPTEIAYYDTPGASGYVFPVYNGPWGVYPYFASGTILGSSPEGLYVLRRATEVSGTIATNTTWSNAIFVTGNVTVNSGATLTISPGTTVAFANGKSLTINGKLVADSNDSTKRIGFTSNSAPLTSGSWNSIKINSGSSTNVSTLRRCNVQYAIDGVTLTYTGNSNNVTIDKCRIRNNSSYGIYIYGSSSATVHPTISNNHIHNNGDGINLYNYAKPAITYNRIESNQGTGIYGNNGCSATVEFNYVSGSGYGIAFEFNSLAQVHRNTVTACVQGAGIYASSSSNLIAYGSGDNKGRNKITANNADGIESLDCSSVFGKNITNQYGNNQIQDNTLYQAQHSGSGQLQAEQCYWAGQQNDISGNVDNSPYLASVPSPVGWGQGDSYDPSYLIPSKDDFIPTGPITFAHMTNAAIAKNGAITNGLDPIAWSAKFGAAMEAGLGKGDWADAAEVITELWRELQDSRVPPVDYTLLNDYAENNVIETSIRKYLALALAEKSLAVQDISTALAELAKYS